MKHLFYIHSHITYLVSLQIVSHRGLRPEDCVFMYGRAFVPDSPDQSIQHTKVPYSQRPVNSFAVEKQFWKGWRKLRGFNSYLKQLLNDQAYHVYTHQTSMDFIRMFMSHRQCVGFSLIEEGVVSYQTLQTVNEKIRPVGTSTWRYDVLKWVNFLGRLSFPIRFFDPGYDKVYGISAYSFPEFARREELPLPFINPGEGMPYSHVLVLDASAENGLTTHAAIKAALKRSMEWLIEQKVGELWVKFHPEQLVDPEAYDFYKGIFDSFSNRISIREMPQQICLELLAGNQAIKELTFYVFVSSVGIYASMCGREVYSFASFITEADAGYHQTIKRLPEAFRESVRFILAAGGEV